MKRRKFEEKWQKKPTGGLIRGKRKTIKSKMAKNTYWRTYLGGKRKIMGKNGKKKYQGAKNQKSL